MRTKILTSLFVIFVLGLAIRLFSLGSNPPSLYWDEASLGYNAFSISQTLRDEHQEFLPLARFTAFGDYKAPGYIYLDAVAIKLLGLSDFSVRLPSALSGSLLILVTFFLAQELCYLSPDGSIWRRRKKLLSLIAAFIVSVSPWSIQLSRAAFEANVATLFSSLGFTLLLFGIRKKSFIAIPIAVLSLVYSMYSFNTHRYVVPILSLALLIILSGKIIKSKKIIFSLLLSGLISLILLVPLIQHVRLREGTLRFFEVTWMNDLEPVTKANQYILDEGNGLSAKILNNRRISFFRNFALHLSDHFNWKFLFLTGDVNPRLSSQDTGIFYFFEAIFLLWGLYLMVKYPGKNTLLIIAWVLIGLIPAALARETPHALRTYNLVPIPQIILALGLVGIIDRLRSRHTIVMASLALLYAVTVLWHLNYYFNHYPSDYSREWQSGYKELVSYISSRAKDFDVIKVSDFYGRPYIYFLLYNKYSPEKYWQTRNVDRDWYGFWTVKGFDKYVFGDISSETGKKGLYVVSPLQDKIPGKLVKTITDYAGLPIFSVYEK